MCDGVSCGHGVSLLMGFHLTLVRFAGSCVLPVCFSGGCDGALVWCLLAGVGSVNPAQIENPPIPLPFTKG